MKLRSTFALLLLSLLPGMAIAGGLAALPEPGVLELIGIGAVVALAVAIRNRRKWKTPAMRSS